MKKENVEEKEVIIIEEKTTIQKFCFPEYGVVMEARTLEEANEKLQEYLSLKK